MSRSLPISRVPLIDESEASEEVSALYDEYRTAFQTPTVTTLFQALGNSTASLSGALHLLRAFFLASALPLPLKFMVLYAIARANDCEYCSTMHEATCRVIGIDDDSLRLLTEDLKALEPRRVRVIVDFAVKCATAPKSLQEEDYERLRDNGITEEEVVDIIMLAAMGNFSDTVADALKLDGRPIFTGLVEG